jgi:uncharacterized protein (TIGR03083 family)
MAESSAASHGPTFWPVSDDVRDTFTAAADFFVEVVARVPSDRWDAPGLGVWSVRDLTGHTSRALSTVCEYLHAPPPPAEQLSDAVEYFSAFSGGPDLSEAIAERGRHAGAALGGDPAGAVAEEVRRAMSSLAGHPDDRLVATRGGGMRLGAYLLTRTFELMVHTLDLAAAAGIPAEPPPAALRATLHVAADLAVRRGQGARVCLALTGRGSWPDGLSVL